jgi:hypothetical protein
MRTTRRGRLVLGTRPVPPTTSALPPPRDGVLRAAIRRWHLGALAVVALGFAAPIGMTSNGTARARACVASYRAARGPELPDCREAIRWFVTPSRVPWTATPARYRAEELTMRQAIAAYADAAIGRPDAGALTRAAEGLVEADKVIRGGSQRVRLEELGPAVGAPDLGRSAMLLGDRRTLLARFDSWPHWSVRLRALTASMLEGDAALAAKIAKRYAEFDPRDEDLRVAVAATLCLSGEAERALSLLPSVQTARARDRHESWARNWGELRAAIVACAAKAGVAAPPLPEREGAGTNDRLDARTALRLRLLPHAEPRDPFAIRDAADAAIELLSKVALPRGARVRLIAGILGLGRSIEPDVLATIATPREADGEGPLLGHPIELTAAEQLGQGRGLHAIATPVALRDAAAELRRVAALDTVTDEARDKLRAAAAATALEAARAFSANGDAASAIAVLDAADLGPRASLARSSARYVAGDAARALEALDRGPALGKDAIGVASRIQRAELLASLGRRDEAAREATAADALAATLGDRRLDLRAQWTRLALAHTRRSSVPAPKGLAFPWVGVLATPSSWLEAPAESMDAFASALAFWDAARRAPGPERRALRYAVVEPHAGDAPPALAVHLAIAAELLAPDEGDVEVWLDAVGATSGHGVPMRGYAFARMEAARFRGDDAAAARWSSRYRALVKLAAPAEDAELCAVLGI